MTRNFAFLAFVLLTFSLWTPWWTIEHAYADGEVYDDVGVGFWNDRQEVDESMVWVTIAATAVALLLLVVRLAATSWKLEPKTWRRDLGIATAGLLVALVATTWWPSSGEPFWGGRTFTLENGETFNQITGPAFGWWAALLAALCLVVALVLSLRRPQEPRDEPLVPES